METCDLGTLMEFFKQVLCSGQIIDCCYCHACIASVDNFSICEICSNTFHKHFMCGNSFDGRNLCNRCYLTEWIKNN